MRIYCSFLVVEQRLIIIKRYKMIHTYIPYIQKKLKFAASQTIIYFSIDTIKLRIKSLVKVSKFNNFHFGKICTKILKKKQNIACDIKIHSFGMAGKVGSMDHTCNNVYTTHDVHDVLESILLLSNILTIDLTFDLIE